MNRYKGFTLVELMVTIAVAAILIGIAMPSLSNLSASNALKSTTRELISTINTARSQSISTRTQIQVNPASSGWDAGWSIVYANDAAEESQEFEPEDGVSIARTGGSGGLTFLPRGGLQGGPTTFTVCHSKLENGRTISVSFLGKVTTEVGSC